MAPSPRRLWSAPVTIPPTRAAHTNPTVGATSSRARIGTHRPSRIRPTMSSSAAVACGVPGAIDARNHRATGSGSPVRSSSPKTPGPGSGTAARSDANSSL